MIFVVHKNYFLCALIFTDFEFSLIVLLELIHVNFSLGNILIHVKNMKDQYRYDFKSAAA